MSAETSSTGAHLPPAESWLDVLLREKHLILIACLCVYAGARILLFSAAFPIGNNVDEQSHFDTVYRFVKGAAPQKELPTWDADSIRLFVLYMSPEYLNSAETMHEGHWEAPVALIPRGLRDRAYHQVLSYILNSPRNIEAQSPPTYYAVASVWYQVGVLLGLKDWELFYWVRLLNVLCYSFLVWISYRFVAEAYPGHQFLRLAVPALIAVFPQDVFFGVSRDVLSAPCAALALWLMFKMLRSDTDRLGRGLATGLSIALTFLVNVSNSVLFGALGLTFWARTRAWSGRKSGGFPLREAGLTTLTAILPPGLWMLQNYRLFGDLTGSKAKIEALHWTVKPVAAIFQHPIFSWSGASDFLTELMRSFWRGEYVWHGQSMSLAAADWLYITTSCLLLAAFTVQFLVGWNAGWSLERFSDFLALFLVVSSVLFMVAISLAFDFHDCFYPSRLHPYFVSGRIISGTILPFSIIYVRGLEFVLKPIRAWVHPAVGLALLMLTITASELIVRSPAFTSPFNFFALAGWR